jgi:hypothetical protein
MLVRKRADGHREGHVHGAAVLEDLPVLLIADQGADGVLHEGVRGGGGVEEPRPAVHADHRGRGGLEVQV